MDDDLASHGLAAPDWLSPRPIKGGLLGTKSAVVSKRLIPVHHKQHKHTRWNYGDKNDDADWSEATGATICKTGKRQSPINIVTSTIPKCQKTGKKENCNKIKFNYGPTQAT